MLFLLFVGSIWSLKAQDIYLMNNIQNPMQFNPAATGLVYNHRIAASEQIMPGWSDGPLTAQINYEKSIDSTAWGFGVLALYDDIGFFDEEHLEGHLRYSFINRPKLKWAGGLSLIYSSKHFHMEPDNSRSAIYNSDPAIPEDYRIHAARYAIGSWFRNSWLNAGVSFYGTIHLFGSNQLAGFPFYNRYTAYASAKIIDRKNFQLSPDLFLLSDQQNIGSTFFYGLNCSLWENYRLGLKVRNNKNIVPSVGFNFWSFSVDAAFVIPSKTTTEFYHTALQLAYNFN